MGKLKLLLLLASSILAACQGGQEQLVEPVVRPVKTMLVGSAQAGGVRHFPGLVDASQRADLSFRVPGRLNKILVKEGDRVKKGQILAELDATDFQIVVNDKQALFSRAKADFERAKKLVSKGHISRMDYDRLQAEYKSRLADLKKAQRDLGYTVLRAPFSGTIARRLVDNFEEIAASQTIFALRNNKLLEVKINVPENIVLKLKRRKQNDPEIKVPVWASFDTVPGKRFPLKIKEVSTKADPKTQTFLATFVMPAPEGLTVLPGMTANVTADLSARLQQGQPQVHYVPISAVTANARLQPRIWIVDEASMSVRPKKVTLGKMQGSRIEILSGLDGGERVVTAGAAYMAEGMKVSLLPETEQARPRPEDMRLSLGLQKD